ncbi:MAG: tryptophan--tRNA ligase [Deltaproteobacteria bacterium]|nr:tryptophan--tRNA ligase [Deltaproteobacteria bacterium]
MRAPRICSGIQPSGALHLGNYFGAIRPQIDHQDGAFLFIADYHALTTLRDPVALDVNRLDAAATYLALGLDPSRATLFLQSSVPEVTELTWILATVTPMGLLERAVSYKDRVGRNLPTNAGLFLYPALMAADILAYRSEQVLVGSDQVQHVEIARDIALAFHSAFRAEVFALPKVALGVPVPIPGIDGAKMSKSYGNHIPIFASDAELEEKVMAIRTDSRRIEDPKIPEEDTVFALYSLFASQAERDAMAERYLHGGYGYGEAKRTLLEAIREHLGPARARKDDWLRRKDELRAILDEGASRAREAARKTLLAARDAVGLSGEART